MLLCLHICVSPTNFHTEVAYRRSTILIFDRQIRQIQIGLKVVSETQIPSNMKNQWQLVKYLLTCPPLSSFFYLSIHHPITIYPTTSLKYDRFQCVLGKPTVLDLPSWRQRGSSVIKLPHRLTHLILPLMSYFVSSLRTLGRNEVNISIVQSAYIVDIIQQSFMAMFSAQPHPKQSVLSPDMKRHMGLSFQMCFM